MNPVGQVKEARMVRRLTTAAKDRIRNSPCGCCGSVPPFADGGRCHAHRIVPGHVGGQYVVGNVVPRCPTCHDVEHDGKIAFLEAATNAVSPAQRRVYGRKGGRSLWDNMTSRQRKEFVQRREQQRMQVTTAEERRTHAKHAYASITPEQHKVRIARLSEGIRKSPKAIAARQKNMRRVGLCSPKDPKRHRIVSQIGAHTRWHVLRGVIQSQCQFCNGG